MAFADLLDLVGGMGRFQFIEVALLAFPVLMLASHNLMQNFSAGIPSHHCHIKAQENTSWGTNESLMDRDTLKVFIPLDGNQKPEKCLQFAEPQWWLLTENATVENMTVMDKQPCPDGWTYDTSVFSSTIVTEWDLVCDRRTRRQMAQSIYMAGVLVGAIVFGSLSDSSKSNSVSRVEGHSMQGAGTGCVKQTALTLHKRWDDICWLSKQVAEVMLGLLPRTGRLSRRTMTPLMARILDVTHPVLAAQLKEHHQQARASPVGTSGQGRHPEQLLHRGKVTKM